MPPMLTQCSPNAESEGSSAEEEDIAAKTAGEDAAGALTPADRTACADMANLPTDDGRGARSNRHDVMGAAAAKHIAPAD